MKRKATIATLAGALLLGGGWWFCFHREPNLPRIPLAGGGEFRVFKICYGTEEVHRLGGTPKQIVWLWGHLPNAVQRFLPAPDFGDGGLVPRDGDTALSIYWAWVEPGTQKPSTGPSGDVLMTTDSGEQTNLGWPEPFDDRQGGGFRQIFVVDPPKNSSKLRFRVPVEEEVVEFTIDNPASRK